MLNLWSLDEAIEYWRKKTKDFKKNCSYQSVSVSEQHIDWLEELKEFRAEDRKSKDTRPLTPYELMGMDGQEVWVKLRRPIGTFPMLSRCFVDVLNMRMVEDAAIPSKYYGFGQNKGYWEQWVAYRNKPEVCDDKEDH